MNKKMVYIVDDDLDFRESLVWLLESAGHQVGAFGSGEEFLAACSDSYISGCLLLDVRMTGMSGLALQQELNQRSIKLPVIIITGHADVGMAVQAMKNQAVDFIEKPFDDEALLDLVASLLKNVDGLSETQAKQRQVAQRWQLLSKREKQVAQLVVDGRVNREIAEQLSISIKTVEIHRSRVMSKMQAKNITGLMKLIGEMNSDDN
ncbi:MAG: two-component system response regulator FixJ [Paraglaciecola sp.]